MPTAIQLELLDQMHAGHLRIAKCKTRSQQFAKTTYLEASNVGYPTANPNKPDVWGDMTHFQEFVYRSLDEITHRGVFMHGINWSQMS